MVEQYKETTYFWAGTAELSDKNDTPKVKIRIGGASYTLHADDAIQLATELMQSAFVARERKRHAIYGRYEDA